MNGTWHRRLAVRLIVVLSVALVPIGLLSVMQTGDLARQARERENTALRALTRDAASAEREAIQHAFGMASGISPLVLDAWNDSDACAARLATFISQQALAVTAGAIRPDGDMWCASTGTRYDFRQFPGWDEEVAAQEASVAVNPNAPISGRPVIVVSQPFYRERRFAGFIFVSIPHEKLALQTPEHLVDDLTVITFTPSGEVLSADGANAEDPSDLLPKSRPLSSLVGQSDLAFRDQTEGGETHSFVVAPVVDGTIYVLGTWQPSGVAAAASNVVPSQLFPIIMWLTSLGVAFATVHRLVIRHIGRLRRQMRGFAKARTMPAPTPTRDVSTEIAEIETSFSAMAETVLRDEAELEQLVHDKNVLLKEVHHRVKNNLQLISSIMNMQIREAKAPEARAALERLQDRVLGLASVHQSLYQTENFSQVHAGRMLAELTDQLLAVGRGREGKVTIDRHLDDVVLYPDQALPLSLFVAEATTNALKHLDAEASQKWLKLALHSAYGGEVTVEIANSRAPRASPEEHTGPASKTSGLGINLMRAFALQLGGEMTVDASDDRYAVKLSFAPQPFETT